MKVSIEKEQALALLEYLSTRPYQEVANVMQWLGEAVRKAEQSDKERE